MIKETLIEMFRGGSPMVAAVLLSFAVCWLILVLSCFIVNWQKVTFTKIIPWVILGTLYSVVAQAFFPYLPCAIGIILLLVLCMRINGIKITHALATAFVIVAAGVISSFPFASFVKSFNEAQMIIAGTLAESIGPIFVSVAIKIFSKR